MVINHIRPESKDQYPSTYIMVETFAPKIPRKPSERLFHSCSDLKVTGVPVIGQVVLLAYVAQDGNTV